MLKNINKKILISLAGIVIILSASMASMAFSKEDAVASVEGEKINKDELYNLLVEQYGAAALDVLITEKIIGLEAKKEKVSVSDKEIEEELQTIKESYGGEEAFSAALEQNGASIENIESDIESYLTTEKLLKPRITITDEELKAYFDENKEVYDQTEQVKASHILVEDVETAQEAAEKLAAGGDFGELAKEYSVDTATAEKGGDLGYFGSGNMVAEFEKAAFSLKIDEISKPVKTEYGYHIIKVTDKKAAKEAVFEDHKAEIEDTLFQEKMQTEYSVWLEETLADYKIENTLK
ncbi:peptidylprolyl isomerase [Mesobacillus harenae]|uniref:peptidylprolyl isomerase n=1 Tax=Mesobacillus harenae TaxID=2213203 RepID=UPI0015805E3B|nr:peptidylprolyl isomerase [Mesobacillus harenae]